MMFVKKKPQEAAFNGNAETGRGLAFSPFIAVFLISIAGASMVGAYLLGFRAGHTSGLELALSNSVSHVVRSPIAKSAIEPANNNSDSSDVYAKLKEPTVARQEASPKQAEVSKEVKDFLQPTPVSSQKAGSQSLKTDSSAKAGSLEKSEVLPVSAMQEKKQADTAAIQRVLSEAKQEEDIASGSKNKVENAAVRVIGGSSESLTDHPGSADEKEDFSDVATTAKGSDAANNANKANNKPAAKEKSESISKVATSKAGDSSGNVAAKTDLKSKDSQTAKLTVPVKKPEGLVKKQGLPPGWYSQVAAPRSLIEAQNVSSRLRSAGFRAIIETAEVRDEQYYRVVVGPEKNRLLADQVLMRLKKQTIVKTEPFIRMVR